VTCVIPLFGLTLMSFVPYLTTLLSPFDMLTLANWDTALNDPGFRRGIQNSLIISTVGSAIMVVFVTVAALVAHRSQLPGRQPMSGMLMYPRAIPGISLGIGFFWLLLMIGEAGTFLRTTIWGEMIALTVRNMTLAYIVLFPALSRISQELDRAAVSSGASWWRTLRSILFPMLRPAIIVAFMLMFVSMLNDYDPVVFMQTEGTEVMGVTMLNAWLNGLPGPVAALAVLQVLIVVLVLGVGLLFGIKANSFLRRDENA
jgi:iron(III) transport system permease protein